MIVVKGAKPDLPTMDFLSLITYFLIIVPSAIFHEYMHGWTADQLGDPTARYAGRLTLNPKSHIDLFGTIILPIVLSIASGGGFLFAYAKPVPYNPYNLKNQKWGPALVGLSGPMANFMLAAAFAVLSKIAPISLEMYDFFQKIIIANLGLMVFNLVPIPPLDGSKLLAALWPSRSIQILAMFERYGLAFLLIFILFGTKFLAPIIFWLYRLLMQG